MQRQVQGPGCFLILEGGHTGYSLLLITFILLVVIPLIHFLGMNEVLRLVFYGGQDSVLSQSLCVEMPPGDAPLPVSVWLSDSSPCCCSSTNARFK